MPNESAKSGLGRQSQLPFKRAFLISLNSLKIRFWRSTITAGGIFLGIAFLTVVLTQSLLQWPIVEKVDAGYVRISGQINGPGDFDVWKPIPVQEGLQAGIPQPVLDKIAGGKDTFRLAAIVQGQIDAKRADKNLKRVREEWKGLSAIKDKLTFYMDCFADKDMKVSDAVKYGVPVEVARRLAKENKSKTTFKGSALADVVREQPKWIEPLYSGAILDQDININDAIKGGVPPTIARMLAGQGKTFKAGAINDAITRHPTWLKIWESRKKRNEIFKTVPKAPIVALGKKYAVTLNDVLKSAQGFAKDADRQNVMVVNVDRKYRADFDRRGEEAGNIKLEDGDTILAADLNSRYRTWWLVAMSLLVCTVGITNSMLMAVTERFKEIGTMKCLGALDSFVVQLFMLESSMMGIAASVMGWVVGFVIIVLLAGFTRGWDLVGTLGFLEVLRTFGYAVFIGMALTTIATIAPALRAASMPAAMALRSEI